MKAGQGSSGRVVVVGSVNVDLTTRVSRLPRPGETVSGREFRELPGGKGANQAIAAARLGAETWLIGVTGADERGERARRVLEEAGVRLDALGRHPAEPTGVAQILVDDSGENLIAVASGANAALTAADVERLLPPLLGIEVPLLDAELPLLLRATPRLQTVVLAGFEVPDEAVLAAARLCRAADAVFILNPAPARPIGPELLPLCSVVTPNEGELAALGPGTHADETVDHLLTGGAQAVIVTRGGDGADLHRRGLPTHQQPAFDVQPVDTTGAGDAFNGALAWALSAPAISSAQSDARSTEEPGALEQAMELAAAAGAYAARSVGAQTSPPDRATLEQFMREAKAR